VFLRLLLPPLPPSDRTDAPRCVLVLGAGRRSRNGSLRLSTRSLLRLEAAAALARRERLPLLVSGGAPGIEGTSEAELMARAVGKRDAALTIWRETDSHNTYENALFSARELAQHVAGLAPLTLRATKEQVRRLRQMQVERLDYDDLTEMCFTSRDFRHAVESFISKQAPAWEGR